MGNVGKVDVDDCGELVKATLERFKHLINPKRVATYGGSHGGYLTGMLIGSPKYKDLFSSAILWNPCINFNYMYASTDIPDWIRACILGKDLEY